MAETEGKEGSSAFSITGRRMRPTNKDGVFNALELADQSVTSQNCLNYYKNMKKYVKNGYKKKFWRLSVFCIKFS